MVIYYLQELDKSETNQTLNPEIGINAGKYIINRTKRGKTTTGKNIWLTFPETKFDTQLVFLSNLITKEKNILQCDFNVLVKSKTNFLVVSQMSHELTLKK